MFLCSALNLTQICHIILFIIIWNNGHSDQIDLSGFSGNIRRDDDDKSRDCWTISDGNNFRIRGKTFFKDKSKVIITLLGSNVPDVSGAYSISTLAFFYFLCEFCCLSCRFWEVSILWSSLRLIG